MSQVKVHPEDHAHAVSFALEQLAQLIARVEAARGPDRMLDAELTVLFDIRADWCVGYGSEIWIDKDSGLDEPVIRINTIGKRSSGHPPMGAYATYTASIDAALALVARVLPGTWTWDIGTDEDADGLYGYACLWQPGGKGPDEAEKRRPPQPALSLIAALLRAVQAQRSRHNARDGSALQTTEPPA